MLVLFDGVWNPVPVAGAQPERTPHVHNSQWVQSPGVEILGNLERHDELEPYVKGVIRRFRRDPRVLVWDLFNEPDNPNILSYADVELRPDTKAAAAVALLRKAFVWARSVNPMQPITAGVWQGKAEWGNPAGLSPMKFVDHRIRRPELPQLRPARAGHRPGRGPATIRSAAALHRVHGSFGWEHLPGGLAHLRPSGRRRLQLGARQRPVADDLQLGFFVPMDSANAESLVPRRPIPRRDAVR